MNIFTTTQSQSLEIAATPELINAKAGARIEHFFMLFIIAASLFCVMYLLEGCNPVQGLIADYPTAGKTTLGFLAN